MLTLATLLAIGLGALAVAVSYRRRSTILAPNAPMPSAALTSVLAMDLAAASLLALVALGNPSGLLLLPLLILAGYIALTILVLWFRPEWKSSPLFLLGAGAPLFGCVLAFLIHFAERRRPR